MFKDQYNKIYQDAAPSDALQQETLALMAEAQEHLATEPKQQAKPKRPFILPLSLSAAAAALALTVGLAFWFNRPKVMNDQLGSLDDILAGDSAASNIESEALSGSNTDGDKSGDKLNGSSSGDEATDTAAPHAQDTDSEGDASEDHADDQIKSEEIVDEYDDPSNEPQYDGADKYDPSKGPTDDELNASDSTEPVDPRAPIIIDNADTETYLTLQSFLDGLSQESTLGYKKNYYADRSLIVAPTQLPQTARFRQLHLSKSGKYSYSYLFTADGQEYFLDIEMSATLPKTLRDLNMRTASVKTEKVGFDKKGYQRIYYFGNYDECTVTVTPLNGAAPTAEQVDVLLAEFQIARCIGENPLLTMTY